MSMKTIGPMIGMVSSVVFVTHINVVFLFGISSALVAEWQQYFTFDDNQARPGVLR
jgi:hypothetical protein